VFDNGGFRFTQADSIDSLSPESSPLRASSMSLGPRRLHSCPRLIQFSMPIAIEKKNRRGNHRQWWRRRPEKISAAL
jgi:hypothetical protein